MIETIFHKINQLLISIGNQSLLNQINHNFASSHKLHIDDIVTTTDINNNSAIISLIKELFPNDAIVSEECAFIPGKKDENIWFIDPLDGTREYKDGLDEWCIQVALFQFNGTPIASWIWEARQSGILWAWHSNLPKPITLDSKGNIIQITQNEKINSIVATISRGHPDTWTSNIVSKNNIITIPSGSAGVKVCRVIRNEANIYINGSGKMKVWDWAAPYAIAKAYGVVFYHLNGNKLQPWNPNFYSFQNINQKGEFSGFLSVNEKIICSNISPLNITL